ncbi:MAG TPA: hypothetical protein VN455_13100 [Methanotrichaceae archaeon]|nr:hypothetical protein [Methanotrichaceae archaeon]
MDFIISTAIYSNTCPSSLFSNHPKINNLVQPTWNATIMSVEVSVDTAKRDIALSGRLVSLIERLPGMTLVPLGHSKASQDAEMAMKIVLSGVDAVYLAVAEAFDATLVSWDKEILQRTPESIPATSPSQWLATRHSNIAWHHCKRHERADFGNRNFCWHTLNDALQKYPIRIGSVPNNGRT